MVKRNRQNINLLLICFCLATAISTRDMNGQTPGDDANLARNIYSTYLSQIETLHLSDITADSLFIEMVAEARQFAGENDWTSANAILETVLDLLGSSIHQYAGNVQRSTVQTSVNIENRNKWQYVRKFELESGVDYSRQEFEMSFLENDSVLADELQSPYVSFNWYQPLWIGAQPLMINQRFRLDDLFLSHQVFGSYEHRTRFTLRLETDHSYFHLRDGFEGDFLDHRVQVLFGKPADLQTRWYVSARGRYKWYPKSNGSGITSVSGIAYLEQYLSPAASLYANWMPALYQEVQGYGYSQQQLNGGFRIWENINRYFEPKLTFTYYDFESRQSETVYENSYWELKPELNGEWGASAHWGLEAQLQWSTRRHRTADAVMPDFQNTKLRAIPKFYLNDATAFGIGGFWERQTHHTALVDQQTVADEADYLARGVHVSIDILNAAGLMLSIAYELGWRDYPNANTETFFSSFYADRRVHSLLMVCWIPITPALQLQALGNYNNDQDRSEARNDSRNTLLSLGFMYAF